MDVSWSSVDKLLISKIDSSLRILHNGLSSSMEEKSRLWIPEQRTSDRVRRDGPLSLWKALSGPGISKLFRCWSAGPWFHQDVPPPPPQNEPMGRVPSPLRPEIPSMASLNLNEQDSSRSHRSSQYSFSSQDARNSLSFELTKTGKCTFEDVASKVRFSF